MHRGIFSMGIVMALPSAVFRSSTQTYTCEEIIVDLKTMDGLNEWTREYGGNSTVYL